MKRKVICLMGIIMLMGAFAVGCGQKNADDSTESIVSSVAESSEEKEPEAEASKEDSEQESEQESTNEAEEDAKWLEAISAYEEVLKDYRYYLEYPDEMDMDKEGYYGLAGYGTGADGSMADEMGYWFADLGGDGIPELLVGNVPYAMYEGSDEMIPTEILAVWALEKDEPSCVLEGWWRSSIRVLDDDTYLHQYSSGGGDYGYRIFKFEGIGAESKNIEGYRFAYELDGEEFVDKCYHITSEIFDYDLSEGEECDPEDAYAFLDGAEERVVNPEITLFTEIELDDAYEPKKETLFDVMENNERILASILYLGSMYEYSDVWEYLCAMGLDTEYAFVENIPQDHIVDASGFEVYAIVPRSEDITVSVYDWYIGEENNYEGEAGDRYFTKKDGQPLVVIGNMSDIMPNFYLEISNEDGVGLGYSPFLSGEDGQLHVLQESKVLSQMEDYTFLYDATNYNLIFEAWQNLSTN